MSRAFVPWWLDRLFDRLFGDHHSEPDTRTENIVSEVEAVVSNLESHLIYLADARERLRHQQGKFHD